MSSSRRRALCINLVLALFADLISSAQTEGDIRTQRVQFVKGAISATVKGTIKSDETADYLIGAANGRQPRRTAATPGR
jgi:hypothetical protein